MLLSRELARRIAEHRLNVGVVPAQLLVAWLTVPDLMAPSEGRPVAAANGSKTAGECL
jgi:hypothetical protein